MGVWDFVMEVSNPGLYRISTAIQKRNEAHIHITTGGLKRDVETMLSHLDDLDTALSGAEIASKAEYAEQIAQVRKTLSEITEKISVTKDYYEAAEEVWTFMQDIKSLGRFKPGQDPLGEAKAYGKAITNFGKIASRIPILKIYASFLEEIGGVFAQTVANIVPHLRGTYQRENEKYTRGGDPNVFSAP